MRVVKGVIHQPFEVKGNSIFYAFSYYYDRAVESGLIGMKCFHHLHHSDSFAGSEDFWRDFENSFSLLDGTRGGVVEVRDFKKRAKEGKTPDSGRFPLLISPCRSKSLPHTLYKHKLSVLICIWGSRQSHSLHKMTAPPPHKHTLFLSHTNTWLCVFYGLSISPACYLGTFWIWLSYAISEIT